VNDLILFYVAQLIIRRFVVVIYLCM
jgi:hypothetical protein